MKKSYYLWIILIVIISLVGCTSDLAGRTEGSDQGTVVLSTEEDVSENRVEKQEIEPIQSTPTTEQTSESGIDVDTGLFDVTITLPASFFEDSPDFDPETYNEEQGYKKTVINEDGSVSITMSKTKHNELMAETKSSIDQSFMELIEAEDTPYIKAVTSSNGYKTVTVDVEKEAYESSFDLTPLLIGFSAMLYQQIDGADLHCEVIIRDYDTGEVLSSVVYPDALED